MRVVAMPDEPPPGGPRIGAAAGVDPTERFMAAERCGEIPGRCLPDRIDEGVRPPGRRPG